MSCYIHLMTAILCTVLFALPLFFYFYERAHNMSANWSLRKTLILLGGLIICVGLAVPALQRVVFLVCR